MFITPNMTNDAHDTNITFAGEFLNRFMTPLLKNDYFTKDTLILLTFDETASYNQENRVYSILLGDAVPKHLKGTTDDTFYTHYSVIASLSANWGLPSLGRWDCGANLLNLVAEKTGYVNWEVDLQTIAANDFFNQTAPGPLSDNIYSKYTSQWPVPTVNQRCSAGHGILETVKKTYAGHKATYDYTSPVPFSAPAGINVGVKYSRTLVSLYIFFSLISYDGGSFTDKLCRRMARRRAVSPTKCDFCIEWYSAFRSRACPMILCYISIDCTY
jgi:acid phosphatase